MINSLVTKLHVEGEDTCSFRDFAVGIRKKFTEKKEKENTKSKGFALKTHQNKQSACE